jgi:hypothetical protein
MVVRFVCSVIWVSVMCVLEALPGFLVRKHRGSRVPPPSMFPTQFNPTLCGWKLRKPNASVEQQQQPLLAETPPT